MPELEFKVTSVEPGAHGPTTWEETVEALLPAVEPAEATS